MIPYATSLAKGSTPPSSHCTVQVLPALFTHLLFETFELVRCQCVCLGYDWNDIHELMQLLHELDVNGSQPTSMSMYTGGGVGGGA